MKQANIILIEDNDDDVLMIKRAFKKGKLGNTITRFKNGREGLDYITQEKGSRIDIILLDLNMEVMNGFDFLEEIRTIEGLKNIPVVVLTSSHREVDINRAYDLGANSYVEKPIDPTDFINKILTVEKFWLLVAQRPTN